MYGVTMYGKMYIIKKEFTELFIHCLQCLHFSQCRNCIESKNKTNIRGKKISEVAKMKVYFQRHNTNQSMTHDQSGNAELLRSSWKKKLLFFKIYFESDEM